MVKQKLEGQIRYKITIISESITREGLHKTQHWADIVVDSLEGLVTVDQDAEDELHDLMFKKVKL